MEIKETIHKLIGYRRFIEKMAMTIPGYIFDAEPFDLAISALEKQETAKIVVGKSRGGVTLWHECSKCGESVDAKDTYCSGCGRKLSYEEGNEE